MHSEFNRQIIDKILIFYFYYISHHRYLSNKNISTNETISRARGNNLIFFFSLGIETTFFRLSIYYPTITKQFSLTKTVENLVLFFEQRWRLFAKILRQDCAVFSIRAENLVLLQNVERLNRCYNVFAGQRFVCSIKILEIGTGMDFLRGLVHFSSMGSCCYCRIATEIQLQIQYNNNNTKRFYSRLV